MRQTPSILAALILASGCGGQGEPTRTQPNPGATAQGTGAQSLIAGADALSGPAGSQPSLDTARRGFTTKLTSPQPAGEAPPEPPPNVFRLVRYESSAGKLAAYLTPDPGDGKKHPAIVWITGGDCNTINELWEPRPRNNDQTAAAYRTAGIILMLPSLRGGNDNPGRHEGFLGEVDDVISASDDLAKVAYVDPQRIYLGGHSTGGTLAMLVAESTDRFRAVFAFGPADDVSGYPPEFLPFDTSNPVEIVLRSPGRWLRSVRSPLFVLEGTEPSNNLPSLQQMARASTNPLIHFCPVPGFSHFSILAPANELIAAKILRDDGPTTNITLTKEELGALQQR